MFAKNIKIKIDISNNQIDSSSVTELISEIKSFSLLFSSSSL